MINFQRRHTQLEGIIGMGKTSEVIGFAGFGARKIMPVIGIQRTGKSSNGFGGGVGLGE
jgi:hypothetical protein